MLEQVIQRENGTRRVVQACEGASKTEQHHANEVNINSIVSRYAKTGILPESGRVSGYGDFSGVEDYHAACEAVLQAEAAFMALPPEVRKRFSNDPGALLEFLANESNRDEAVKLGLASPVASDEVPTVPVEAPAEPVEGKTAVTP